MYNHVTWISEHKSSACDHRCRQHATPSTGPTRSCADDLMYDHVTWISEFEFSACDRRRRQHAAPSTGPNRSCADYLMYNHVTWISELNPQHVIVGAVRSARQRAAPSTGPNRPRAGQPGKHTVSTVNGACSKHSNGLWVQAPSEAPGSVLLPAQAPTGLALVSQANTLSAQALASSAGATVLGVWQTCASPFSVQVSPLHETRAELSQDIAAQVAQQACG